jgi:THO complex subunit 2
VWAPQHPLTVQAFVEFVRGALVALPSSSSDTSAIPNLANVFGDHLVDIIWTIDAQLDEFLNDARNQITAAGPSSPTTTALLAKASKVKTNAENDKEKLQTIVKALLVCYSLVVLCFCLKVLSRNLVSSVPTRVENGWTLPSSLA